MEKGISHIYFSYTSVCLSPRHGFTRTPLAITQKLICVPQSHYIHWKVELRTFPMVYDMPILGNIVVSYTVGKVSESTFHWKCTNLRTSLGLSMGVAKLLKVSFQWIWTNLRTSSVLSTGVPGFTKPKILVLKLWLWHQLCGFKKLRLRLQLVCL